MDAGAVRGHQDFLRIDRIDGNVADHQPWPVASVQRSPGRAEIDRLIEADALRAEELAAGNKQSRAIIDHGSHWIVRQTGGTIRPRAAAGGRHPHLAAAERTSEDRDYGVRIARIDCDCLAA